MRSPNMAWISGLHWQSISWVISGFCAGITTGTGDPLPDTAGMHHHVHIVKAEQCDLYSLVASLSQIGSAVHLSQSVNTASQTVESREKGSLTERESWPRKRRRKINKWALTPVQANAGVRTHQSRGKLKPFYGTHLPTWLSPPHRPLDFSHWGCYNTVHYKTQSKA